LTAKTGKVIDQTRIIVILLAILAIIAIGMVLKALQSVIIPLLLAWLLSQVLGPPVDFLTRKKAPAGLAISLVLVVLLFVFYWASIFITASANSFVADAPTYQAKVVEIASDIYEYLKSKALPVSEIDLVGKVKKQVADAIGTMIAMVGDLVGALAGIIAKLVTIFIILAFMLVGRPYRRSKIKRAFSPEMATRVNDIAGSVSTRLSSYLVMQTIISLATGMLVWAACRLVGVRSAATWGALAFFLNFIPTIGSIIAGIPPVLIALLQFYPDIHQAVIVGIAILAINQVLGSVVSPKIMGDRLNLSPVVILLSLLFFGWMWGIIGAFLSVVIVSSIKIVCEQVEVLRPISVLMESGKRSDKIADAASQAPREPSQ
jgi:predicted PurR-regulated permease PerM